MAKIYKHLTTQERAVVMTMRDDHCSTRPIAKRLCRSASAISRELKRTCGAGGYDADVAHTQCQARRVLLRRLPKLHQDGVLFQVVRHQLNLLWSPQQIARKLKALWAGVVRIYPADFSLRGKAIAFTPTLAENMRVAWRCAGEDIPARLLPPECQSNQPAGTIFDN